MALIHKASKQIENKEPQYVASVRGEEVKELKVYFDGDDFSLYDIENKKMLKDEHGYPFFGLEKAEELVEQFVLKRDLISA